MKSPVFVQALVQETNLADLKPDLESESTSAYSERYAIEIILRAETLVITI